MKVHREWRWNRDLKEIKKLKKCLTDRTTCDKISTVAAEKAAHRTLTNKQ